MAMPNRNEKCIFLCETCIFNSLLPIVKTLFPKNRTAIAAKTAKAIF